MSIRVSVTKPYAVFSSEMTMRRVFTKFDKDGNGSIDKDELKLVFEELGKLMPEEEITRMMSMADKVVLVCD